MRFDDRVTFGVDEKFGGTSTATTAFPYTSGNISTPSINTVPSYNYTSSYNPPPVSTSNNFSNTFTSSSYSSNIGSSVGSSNPYTYGSTVFS